MSLRSLFDVELNPLELVIRASVIYWFLFLAFRYVLRRDSGSLGMADMLLVVLVADAAQNGMTGGYRTVSEALILLSTILGWNLLIDYLAYRIPRLAHLTEPPPLALVRHGRFVHSNLRKQLLTPGDVASLLREQGIAHLRDVRHAYLEGNGQISAIKVTGERVRPPRDGSTGC